MEHLCCGHQEAGKGGLLTGTCSKMHKLSLSWGRDGWRQQGLHSSVCLKGTANNTYKGLKNFDQQRIWGTDNEWFFYHLPMKVSIPLSQSQTWNQARPVVVKVAATRLFQLLLCEKCMWWACYYLPLSIPSGCSLNFNHVLLCFSFDYLCRVNIQILPLQWKLEINFRYWEVSLC